MQTILHNIHSSSNNNKIEEEMLKVKCSEFFELVLKSPVCTSELWMAFTTSKDCECKRCHNSLHLTCITPNGSFSQVQKNELIFVGIIVSGQDFVIRPQFTCLTSNHGIFKMVFSLRNANVEIERYEINLKVVSDRTSRYVKKSDKIKRKVYDELPKSPKSQSCSSSSSLESSPRSYSVAETPELGLPILPLMQNTDMASYAPIATNKTTILNWTKDVITNLLVFQTQLMESVQEEFTEEQRRLLGNSQQLIHYIQTSSPIMGYEN
jgi:hypothetical protein